MEAEREDKVRRTLESVLWMTEGRTGFDLYLVPEAQGRKATYAMPERLMLDTRTRAREDSGREELQENEGTQEGLQSGKGGSLFPAFVNTQTSPSNPRQAAVMRKIHNMIKLGSRHV